MESLYAKLYNKYLKLKREKESEFDKLNHDQEVKFLNYATAADEMIQHLKVEIDTLYGQIDELTNELASVRSSGDEQQQIHIQKLSMGENQKNDCPNCSVHGRNTVEKDKPNGYKQTEDIHDQHAYSDKGNDAPTRIQQPACCSRRISSSGGGETTGSINCVFQDLFELVHGLKVSVLSQDNELSALAHHQSSGYSFSLTWTTNSVGETELLYRVISLGMIERIAPEWMKEEVIKFSPNMCNVFFERVSSVLKT